MKHEMNLETITIKANQLNALLFTISRESTSNVMTDNLIDLAYELSDTDASWLLDESNPRKGA